MSNNQGANTNSMGMMSPNERLPIQVSKMQQSKRNSEQDSPENNSQTVEPKQPEPAQQIILKAVTKFKTKRGASLFASL